LAKAITTEQRVDVIAKKTMWFIQTSSQDVGGVTFASNGKLSKHFIYEKVAT